MEIVNGCETANGGCSQKCQHSALGPVCSCNNGYHLDDDLRTCVGEQRAVWSIWSDFYLQIISEYYMNSKLLKKLPLKSFHRQTCQQRLCMFQTWTSVRWEARAASRTVPTIPGVTNATAGLATVSIRMGVAVMVRSINQHNFLDQNWIKYVFFILYISTQCYDLLLT